MNNRERVSCDKKELSLLLDIASTSLFLAIFALFIVYRVVFSPINNHSNMDILTVSILVYLIIKILYKSYQLHKEGK